MTDPEEIADTIEDVEDAFAYGHGEPEFEAKIDSSTDAGEGEVMLQKGCRYLEAGEEALLDGGFYSSALEHGFSAIERTFEGYLVIVAGDNPEALKDHSSPYERARAQVPLERETINQIEGFYSANRTDFYYGTSVASRRQARYFFDLAFLIHERVVEFDSDLQDLCICDD